MMHRKLSSGLTNNGVCVCVRVIDKLVLILCLSSGSSRVRRDVRRGTADTHINSLGHVQRCYDIGEYGTGQIGAAEVGVLEITPSHITVLVDTQHGTELQTHYHATIIISSPMLIVAALKKNHNSRISPYRY